MSLIFRSQPTKGLARVTVLREVKENGKRQLPLSLGSFNAKRSPDHIAPHLTEHELYELENYTATARLAHESFNCQFDQLDREIVRMAPDFKEALFKIWQSAKKYDIDFVPDQEMLFAVLNRAKLIEQQLKLLTGGEFSALSNLKIDIQGQSHIPQSLNENQKIMTALFDTGLSPQELADKFNKLAASFGKKATLIGEQLLIIKEKLLTEGKETFQKWYYTLMIDLLKELKVEISNLSPAHITKHWLRLHKHNSFEETIIDFQKQFIELKDNEVCQGIIKKSFIDDELIKMSGLQNASMPTPSIAVEKWVSTQIKSNSDHPTQALNEFKRSFPLSSENDYVKSLINEHFKIVPENT